MVNLAIFMCVVLIVTALLLEYRRNHSVSWTVLLIPLLWMIIISSRSVSQWFSAGTLVDDFGIDLIEQGNPLDRIIYSVLMLGGIAILIKRAQLLKGTMRANRWLFALFLYSMVSIGWSDLPYVSLKRWVKDIGTVVMVLVILTEPEPFESFKALVRVTTYLLVPLSVLFIKYFPQWGRSYSPWTGEIMYIGVGTGKNNLGAMCLISGLVLFLTLVEEWRTKRQSSSFQQRALYLLYGLMILYLIILTNSRTSQACLAASVLIILAFPFVAAKVSRLGFLLITLLSMSGFLFIAFPDVVRSCVALLGRDMTLTGRTDMWNALLTMAVDPILGAGYQNFWSAEKMTALWQKGFQPKQAHNGYLEVYLNLGVVGLALVTVMLYTVYRRLVGWTRVREETRDRKFESFGIAFFAIFLFYNITEASILAMSPLWFVFLFVAMRRYSGIPCGVLSMVPKSVS